MFQHSERLLNVFIVVVALVLCAALFKNSSSLQPPHPQSQRDSASTIRGGTELQLNGVDWSRNGQTLLLVLSSKCHYCTDSAPFYKRLAQVPRETKLISVMPENVIDNQRYLNKIGVSVDESKQASLKSIGVRGTPTLILADEIGVSRNMWVGKLPMEQEEEVLRLVRSRHSSP